MHRPDFTRIVLITCENSGYFISPEPFLLRDVLRSMQIDISILVINSFTDGIQSSTVQIHYIHFVTLSQPIAIPIFLHLKEEVDI